jgi:hypothetical protein
MRIEHGRGNAGSLQRQTHQRCRLQLAAADQPGHQTVAGPLAHIAANGKQGVGFTFQGRHDRDNLLAGTGVAIDFVSGADIVVRLLEDGASEFENAELQWFSGIEVEGHGSGSFGSSGSGWW